MKKKLIATGCTLALIGAAWVGATWYTGKMIEKDFDNTIESAMKSLNELSDNEKLQLTYSHYERGVFSTTFTYQLKLILGENAKEGYVETIHENQVTLYHGPFPLPQLKKFDLKPQLLSYLLNVEGTYQLGGLKELQKISQTEYPIYLQGTVNYAGNSSHQLNIVPMKHNENYTSFNFSGANVKLDLDADQTDNNQFSAKIGNINLGALGNSLLDIHQVSIGTKGKGKNQQLELNVGKAEVNVAMLGNAISPIQHVLLNDLSFTVSENKLNDDLSDFTFASHLNQLQVNKRPLGEHQSNFTITKVPVKTIQALFNNPNALTGFGQYALIGIVNKFIQQQGMFKLEESIKTPKHQSHLRIAYTPSMDENLSYIKSLDVDADLSISMLTDYILTFGVEQMNHASLKITPEMRLAISNQITEAIDTINREFNQNVLINNQPLFIQNGDSITFSVKYDIDNPQAIMNGKSYSNKALSDILLKLQSM